MIEAQSLDKSYSGTRVVHEVSFTVDAGEFVALLGPSGGGKTTVLRMLAGLEFPDAGKVILGGRDVTDVRVQDRDVGFVFQQYALFRHMSVRDNVAFGLTVRKQPRAEIDRRVDELLALVQLEGFGDRAPSQLSGGQRQRVALARALAPRPRLLLLDEPFGALDAKVRIELRRFLRKLQQKEGITSVLVTHDQEEAMELADRVVIIAGGKVEQIGTPAEVYDEPKTAFVASFVGASNVLVGRVDKGRAALGRVDVPVGEALAEGSDVHAFVRHHQVEVLGKADEAPPSREAARAMLSRVVRVGAVVRLELELEDGQALVAELGKERFDALGARAGDALSVRVREASVFVGDYVI